MITNFALSLSFDGIELLHRVPRGWRRVGQVDVDSKTLDKDLKALRKKAELIEPDGIRTKLVIPLDQIKYLALDSTLTSEEDVNAALEGATPYALDELVIDNEKSGGRTHIAAVARETLQEAESFAAAHGFQPVAFVAIPEPFTFQTEVFFGPTSVARSIVGPDALIERDELPVMVVGTRIKSRLLVFNLPEEVEVEEEDFKEDLAALLAEEPSTVSVEEPTPETQAEEPDGAEGNAAEPLNRWIDAIPAEYYRPAEPDVVEVPEAAPAQTPLIPAEPQFAAIALLDPIIAEYHAEPLQSAKPIAKVIKSSKSVAVPAAPTVKAPTAKPITPTAPVANRTGTPQRGQVDKRPALIAASIAAAVLVFGGLIWSSQPSSTEVGADAAPTAVETAIVEAQEVTPGEDVAEATIAPAPVLDDGPVIPEFQLGSLAPLDTGPTDLPQLTAETPTDPLTRPTALLAEAADGSLAEVQPPPAPPVKETALASVGAPVLRGQVPSPDEAARIYEATGVWQRAPRFIDVPSGVIPFEFTAPVETSAPGRVAQPIVPPLEGLDTDLSFVAPANPPAPEIVFPRDEDGFILATEEGTVTPEGAVVFAGLPDLVITPRPELSDSDLQRMAMLAPAPEGVIIIAGRPENPPPLRPTNAALPEREVETPADEAVAVALDDATSDDVGPPPGGVGLGNLELQNSGAIALDPSVIEEGAIVDLRPRLRPQGLAPVRDAGTPDITDIIAGIETEDATLRFDNSTALAVVLSLRPDARPANFGNVVAAARARQVTRPAPAASAPVVAAAPVPPQNFAPVPGGVARAATQEDAIRLREINLIGVYGRANARRALVRLGNGRYVRVEVGSALDGGQVTAIGDDALNYVKRGRTYAIELPSG